VVWNVFELGSVFCATGKDRTVFFSVKFLTATDRDLVCDGVVYRITRNCD